MRVFLFVLLHTFTCAKECLSQAQCDQFKISYPLFENIDSNCEITIENVKNCIIYCAEPCTYPSLASGIASNYHYKPISDESINTNTDSVIVKTNCNSLSLSLRSATNF